MSRRSGLGRGLSSLIPTAVDDHAALDERSGTVLTEVDVSRISPNPNQPRVHFDEESLAELAASISHLGVLQPILVQRAGDRYQLIAGERRWRAAQRAGLDTVPAIVRDPTDDVTVVEQALVENLHRQDLTPLEEAAAYVQLVDDFGLTHDDVAQRVGKNRSTITNTLRLLSLPAEVQRLLADGELTAGHAKALLATPDRAAQRDLAQRITTEGWSVRATEQAVRRLLGAAATDLTVAGDSDQADAPTTELPRPGEPRQPDAPRELAGRPAGLLEVEQLLEERLSTRVRAELGRRGKLTIDFADLDDLTRIYQLLAGTVDPKSDDWTT